MGRAEANCIVGHCYSFMCIPSKLAYRFVVLDTHLVTMVDARINSTYLTEGEDGLETV